MMDRGGIISLVCKLTRVTDQDARDTCALFLQNEYQSVYDKLDWLDGRVRVTAAATAGSDSFNLPDNIARVISIRYGDHFLDPVDDTFFVESDPTIFEREGTPLYYQEFTDTDNLKKVRLYPTPAVDEDDIIVVGKRVLPPLANDSDVPVIRGLDQVLVAYTLADMLKYQRQYAKAQVQRQEADSLYAQAVALEQEQTNVPRRTKQLTVAGNSLAEMTDAVCARIGQWQPDAVIMIKEFIRREYVQVYDAYLWPESLVMARVDSDGSQVILPWYFAAVVAVRADNKAFEIGPVDISSYFTITPQIFEQRTAFAMGYSILTSVGVSMLPPITEKLSFVSSDPDDASKIMVRGEGLGDVLEESVTLNGTSPVFTQQIYDTPLTWAKGITMGDVTCRGASSNVLLGKLMAGERERKHMRLWIQPNANSPHKCLVLGKRAIRPLVQDEDTPAIRNIANYLIHSATARAYQKSGNAQGAADCKADAAASLKVLIDLEVQQNTMDFRVIPWVPGPWDDGLGDYCADGLLTDKFYSTP